MEVFEKYSFDNSTQIFVWVYATNFDKSISLLFLILTTSTMLSGIHHNNMDAIEEQQDEDEDAKEEEWWIVENMNIVMSSTIQLNMDFLTEIFWLSKLWWWSWW